MLNSKNLGNHLKWTIVGPASESSILLGRLTLHSIISVDYSTSPLEALDIKNDRFSMSKAKY